MSRLRIALLTHSTNPRGGVSHALSLAEALTARGHSAAVLAPDPSGHGFYRQARCQTISVPAAPIASTGTAAMVEQRIGDYLSFLTPVEHRTFDIYHAHDGIGGNALADLAALGLIGGFVRTVHHLDRFDDAVVEARQRRAVEAAAVVLCVSDLWQDALKRDFGVTAVRVPNGVDTTEFSPVVSARDPQVRTRLGLGDGPVLLSVGGCEPRKNTLRIIEAFGRFRRHHRTAKLLIVGGASVLDHSAYRRRCETALQDLELVEGPGGSVIRTGAVPQAEMPVLYRLADALVFPSTIEGFGLSALEALACGTPVIASRIPPFTEYLDDDHAILVDPLRVDSIAGGMERAVRAATRQGWSGRGPSLASRFSWTASADAHCSLYEGLIRSGLRRPEALHA